MYSYLLQIKSCFKIIDRADPITIRVVTKNVRAQTNKCASNGNKRCFFSSLFAKTRIFSMILLRKINEMVDTLLVSRNQA